MENDKRKAVLPFLLVVGLIDFSQGHWVTVGLWYMYTWRKSRCLHSFSREPH